jgi:hypothetical protein
MAPETGNATATPSVTVLVPATWAVLDLDPRTRTGSIARLVEERIGGGPDLRSSRRRMMDGLEKAVDTAVTHGAVLGYVLLTSGGGKVAMASLFVSLVDAVGDVDAAGLEPAAGAEGLAARLGGEMCDLPVGPAVRARRRQAVAVDDGASPSDVEIVQWYALHESGRRLALLTFSTPNVGLAGEFGEVFDLIAATLRWTH